MQKIYCSANNCSHNKENICFANRINVVGKNSDVESDTCCGSFLDRYTYGNLTNNVYDEGDPCSCLVCKVNSCKYNENQLCSLNSINVSGNDAKLYSQTNCESFCRE
ncbi:MULTISPECIES: DUF1540 domain-containing protein [unclassified Clostridium]|uniref:DUF1540 domain-containing protein n=1 Tax=unclassified Clostridium TaxID=2614128 RepID=UPI001898901D|nr:MULTISPECIES: DUF1540 domain-containing protein [unclassified Clostridium]MCR1949463.1 DUF1540 domain-containing protein [Clostridium sp. DSM 100503]